jgi:lipoprotein-releasing system permease protein
VSVSATAMADAPLPRGRGFEWFVAWRHLRDPERHSHRMLTLGLVVLALSLITLAISYFLGRRVPSPESFLRFRASLLSENLRLGAIIGVLVGGAMTYLGVLLAAFTVFTAISIFGVFLGTCLPIVTLSVMSGFEVDLKTKIRGAKADVVITVPDDEPRAFTEWADVRARIAKVPGVVASTPYLEGEVMIRSGPSSQGVIIRGIDPGSAGRVLDLGRIMRDGKLDDLLHPERVTDPPRSSPFGPIDDLDRQPDDEEPLKDIVPKGVPEKPAKTAKPVRPGKPGKSGKAVKAVNPLVAEPLPPPAPREILPAIILGEELYAHVLRVFIGNDVEVVCPLCNVGPSGAMPGYGQFRVSGHFYSGMYEFDSKLVYVSLADAQRFLHSPGEVTGIDVRTSRPEDAPRVASELQKVLGKGYEARSWDELNKELFKALRVEKIAMLIALAFIGLVASFSIISTLIMSVTQKAREVAILKSMGATDGAIRRVFFAEGLYIGILGLTVGVASGVLACKLIMRYGLPLPTDVYYISQLPVVMRSGEIMTVAGLALVLCCLATVYPAMLAARMRPVDGLRYE